MNTNAVQEHAWRNRKPMGEQGGLFEARQARTSHHHDPESSRIAARQHVASGRHAKHMTIVLALVAQYPGRTANELWELATAQQQAELKEPQEVRRRLSGAYHSLPRRVQQGPRRACAVKGTNMVSWMPC